MYRSRRRRIAEKQVRRVAEPKSEQSLRRQTDQDRRYPAVQQNSNLPTRYHRRLFFAGRNMVASQTSPLRSSRVEKAEALRLSVVVVKLKFKGTGEQGYTFDKFRGEFSAGFTSTSCRATRKRFFVRVGRGAEFWSYV